MDYICYCFEDTQEVL